MQHVGRFYNSKAIKINPVAAAAKVQSSRTVQRPKSPACLGVGKPHQVAKLPHGSSQVVLLRCYPLAPMRFAHTQFSKLNVSIAARHVAGPRGIDYSSKAAASSMKRRELDKQSGCKEGAANSSRQEEQWTGLVWCFDCGLQRLNSLKKCNWRFYCGLQNRIV